MGQTRSSSLSHNQRSFSFLVLFLSIAISNGYWQELAARLHLG